MYKSGEKQSGLEIKKLGNICIKMVFKLTGIDESMY